MTNLELKGKLISSTACVGLGLLTVLWGLLTLVHTLIDLCRDACAALQGWLLDLMANGEEAAKWEAEFTKMGVERE